MSRTKVKRSLLLFSLTLVVFSLILTIMVGQYKKRQIGEFAMQNSISLANYIAKKVQFESERFHSPLPTDQLRVLENELEVLSFSFGAKRLKIWDANGTVLYSNNRELIGRTFATGEEFQAAARGKTVVEFSKLKKEENVLEQQERVLLEVYTPLLDRNNKQIGVAEFYYDVTPVERFLSQYEWLLKGIVVLLTLVSLLLIYRVSHSATKAITRSETEMEKARDKASLLLETTVQITSSLTIEEILDSISSAIKKYLSIRSVAVFFLDRSTKQFYLKKHSRVAGDLAELEGAECCKKLNRIFEGNQDDLYLKNISKARLFTGRMLELYGETSGYLVPIRWNGQLYGLILFEAHEQRDFEPEEISIFLGISNQIGVAIRNAQLFSQVSNQAQRDELTQLYNYRHFQEKLGQLLLEKAESGEPVSLLLLDLDHFKKFNDTYGHPAGNQVLQQLASILRSSARSKDIAARYGGEEFLLVLEGCGLEEGVQVAERIRKEVENYHFNVGNVRLLDPITVSIGVASFPEQAADREQLIEKADQALYAAKKTRNRVCAYGDGGIESYA
ncbi:sensor domain-containing diguanylate cyclase [Effusibacillus lacus]|uniref:GGDEF domain-containing protein n=1 Tax=Effusibacillus lacus TaxID=1348429 RepID=A0A292YN49_9BACL|nr:diguanylate cyclase [Effusibacillus lacus]TCS76135.1 diguanylate cyclase (GGDEF)-like protein [Effusibacillus lacus]GAX91358.1 hypothetical protein EFBL_3027 [Effusibacillus lacus]